jgi:hypothetical protein
VLPIHGRGDFREAGHGVELSLVSGVLGHGPFSGSFDRLEFYFQILIGGDSKLSEDSQMTLPTNSKMTHERKHLHE